MKRSLVGPLACAAVTFASLAHTEPSTSQKALANQLFDDAQTLMMAGKLIEACPKYAESQRLDPQLGTLLHLGECYERQGKLASAWSTFKDAVEIAAARKDTREMEARSEIWKLERTVPRLVLVVGAAAPKDLVVKQDGEPVGRAAWGTALPVDAGRHRITATASGIEPRTLTVTVPPAGPAVRVEVLEPEREPGPMPAARPGAAADGVEPQDRGAKQRTIGYVVGGFGVAGLVVGAISKELGFGKQSTIDAHCDASRACDQTGMDAVNAANTFQTIGTVSLIVGGAALGTGIVLVVSSPKSGEARASIQPTLVPGGGGLSVGGRF